MPDESDRGRVKPPIGGSGLVASGLRHSASIIRPLGEPTTTCPMHSRIEDGDEVRPFSYEHIVALGERRPGPEIL
jgi:hypothetical protein